MAPGGGLTDARGAPRRSVGHLEAGGAPEGGFRVWLRSGGGAVTRVALVTTRTLLRAGLRALL